jgi:Ca2+-binding EF-hand superfamily protein
MSTISGISSASSAWSEMSGSARSTSRADRMFAKVDADGSGSVDKTELQGLLDKMAEKSGNTLGSADDLMTKMDSDGNGSLSKDELDAGMKSLMPKPSSTVDFAQRSGGRPPPPPSGDSDTTGSSTSSTDPLDTNGDGTVSAEERAAGAVKDMVKNLFTAMDSDGDEAVSKSEFAAFKDKLDAMFGSASSTTSASTSSSISVTA